MIRRLLFSLTALVLASAVSIDAGSPRVTAASQSAVGSQQSAVGNQQGLDRHHYSIKARIRPLLFFWISRSGVGEAEVTKRLGPGESTYSLLIGSDPDRTPRRINRWGYISEQIHGANATLVGLMTESEERSIEQAESNIRRQANGGDRTFKMIQATIDGDRATSVVTSIAAPAKYSFRNVRTVLDMARHESSRDADAKTRVVRLPAGTRAGFLTAVSGLIHQHVGEWRRSGRVRTGEAVKYVYHGKIYELRATETHALASVRVDNTTYEHVIASDFEIKNTSNGDVTRFSITYGTEGTLAEVPVTMSYQPRWWMELELTLDDSTHGPELTDAP